MKRRNFLGQIIATGAAVGIAPQLLAQRKTPLTSRAGFNLRYAPHIGMFKNLAGEDPVARYGPEGHRSSESEHTWERCCFLTTKPKGKPSMVTQADLEKRADRLKGRIQKACEGGDRPLPPDGIRRFRKRLKRTQRKLAARAEKAEKLAKQAKSTPTEEKPPEVKAVEEKAPQEQAAKETAVEVEAQETQAAEEPTQEAQAPDETAAEEEAPKEKTP